MVKYPIPQKCLKCGQHLFILNGRRVTPEMKTDEDVFTVLLFCNECKMVVADMIGATTNWYVALGANDVVGGK